MAHNVTFSIPARDLGKADIEFFVKVNGSTLGKLDVSKGSLVWFPKDTQYGHKIGWSEFSKVMQDYPRLEKR